MSHRTGPKFKFKGKDVYNEILAMARAIPDTLLTPEQKAQLIQRAGGALRRQTLAQQIALGQRLGGDTSGLAFQRLSGDLFRGSNAALAGGILDVNLDEAIQRQQLRQQRISNLLSALGLRNQIALQGTALNLQRANLLNSIRGGGGGIWSALAPAAGSLVGGGFFGGGGG
jgi:hypothetical protein